ncbi:MAG: ATP-binding cassette domain-containing protein [Segetibacter sp.]
MIEIKNLKKSFGEKTILNGVSLVMETGKCNLIIGSSGSGKTVLLKCIVGLFVPDDGQVIYDGQSMTELSVQEKKVLRQQIGMLFQGSALFDSMTVEQNIKFPLDMFTTLRHPEKIKKVNEVLARVNMEGANSKFPAEISGGMKKESVLHVL